MKLEEIEVTMPVHSEQDGDKWHVVDDSGKVHGTHGSKGEANDQVIAMNIAMGHVPGMKSKES